MKESRIRELIYLARCGEGDAYEALYNLYLCLAEKIAYELLMKEFIYSNSETVELAHCADELFTKVIKRYDERYYSSPSSYIYLCIKRNLIRARSSQKSVKAILLNDYAAEKHPLADVIADPTPEYNPVAQQNRQIREAFIKQSIADITTPRDAAIVRYYCEGYTPNEIAMIVKTANVWTVYNAITRTLKRLKRKSAGR